MKKNIHPKLSDNEANHPILIRTGTFWKQIIPKPTIFTEFNYEEIYFDHFFFVSAGSSAQTKKRS